MTEALSAGDRAAAAEREWELNRKAWNLPQGLAQTAPSVPLASEESIEGPPANKARAPRLAR